MMNELTVWRPMWAQVMQAPGGVPEAPPPLPFPDVAAPPVVEETLPLIWLVIGSLLILFVIWLLIKPLLNRAAQVVLPARRPLQAALRSLRELRGKASSISPAEVGHAVSETLRVYYLHRYGLPAPFRTTEELFYATGDTHDSSRRRHWREKFEPLAAYYDALAYAPETMTKMGSLQLIDEAINKLESEVGSAEAEPVEGPQWRELKR